ncbi:MAG: hypothetical protein ACK551_03480 [Vampirovibrionales bacterium]
MALNSANSTIQNPFTLKLAGVTAEEQQKRLERLNELLSQNKMPQTQRNGLNQGVSLYMDCMRALELDAPESQHPLLPIPNTQFAYPVRVTDEDKQKNPLLHIPPSLFGYLTIPAAYALVHLPAALKRLVVGEMNEADRAFVDKLMIKDLEKSKYTPEEYAQKVKHAESILAKFKTPEGDKWFESLPAVKYFLTKHFNPKTNRKVAVARLKQQVLMEAMCLKYGLETHRLQDMDGTQVFKNFATATCGVEPNISPKDRLAHYATMAFNVKSREALNYSHQHKDDPRFSTHAMIKDLLALGFYKPTKDGMNQKQLEAYLNVWADNTDKAFPHMSDEQIKYMLLSAIESANTARGGATVNEISEAIPTNDVLGLGVKPHKFNLQGQHDFYSMLGLDRRPDLALQYMFNINGYSGRVVADKQIYHPQQMIELGYSTTYEMRELQKLVHDLTKQDVLPRVVEFKGNYKHYDKELITDHLNWRSERLSSQELAWIKKQDGFNLQLWKAKDPNERAKWVNQMDMYMPNEKGEKFGKPAMAMPHAWVLEMDRLTIDALDMLNELDVNKEHTSYKDFSKVLAMMARRTRHLDQDDHAFFDLPHLQKVEGSHGETIINQERAKRVEAYTHKSLSKKPDGMTPESVIPMGKKFMAAIERLQHKQNLKKEEIEALLKEINTVDFGCLTVHTITAHLQGVYDTWEKVAKQQDKVPHGFETAPETGVLESGKADMYNRFLQAEQHPTVQEKLEELNMVMMKINSSSPELRYKLEDPRLALFNMMNNSGCDLTYEAFEGLVEAVSKRHDLKHLHSKSLSAKRIAEEYGFTKLYDPTGSYSEGSLGTAIDKQGAVNNILNFSRRIHMAGDSTGSDLRLIIDLALLRANNSSEVVRGMIDDTKMFSMMVEVLDFDKDSAKKIAAERTILRQHGFDEAYIKEAVAKVRQQCLVQPLRYQVMGRDAKGNLENLKKLRSNMIEPQLRKAKEAYEAEKERWSKQKLEPKAKTKLEQDAKKKLDELIKKREAEAEKAFPKLEAGIQLMGTGNEKVLEAFGYKAGHLFTEEEYRKLAKKVFTDAIKPSILYADDVGHKHLRDALAKGIVHDEINPLLRFLRNPHLADAFLDKIPGFENRGAFSMGMPLHMGFSLEQFRPNLHKIVDSTGKSIKRNVYDPMHQVLLNLPAFAMKSAQAGGLLAAVGGAIGVGVTYFQLSEHARYQKLNTWDRDNESKIGVQTQEASHPLLNDTYTADPSLSSAVAKEALKKKELHNV